MADQCGEIDSAQMPDPPVRKRLNSSEPASGQFFMFFKREVGCDPVFFLSCEKFGFRGSAGQQEVGDNTAQNSWNALQNEQPSPTANSKPMDVIQNHARQRSTDDVSYSIRGQE